MSVTATIRAGVNGSLQSAQDLGTAQAPFSILADIKLTDGIAASEADKVFADTRTIALSSSESLDLAGSLTDPLGAALTFAKVKAIIVKADPSNTNDVLIGGAASNGFVGPFADVTDIIGVKPGGAFVIAHPGAGWTVTAGTGDLLKVANSGAGTSVTYSIVIIGTSA